MLVIAQLAKYFAFRGLLRSIPIWQRGGGYDRNIFSNEELIEKIEYIENNPVRAGLARIPSAYMWSSASRRGAR